MFGKKIMFLKICLQEMFLNFIYSAWPIISAIPGDCPQRQVHMAIHSTDIDLICTFSATPGGRWQQHLHMFPNMLLHSMDIDLSNSK